MKTYKLILLLFFIWLSSFGQSQIEFCKTFTNNARTNSLNFKKSYFTYKEDTFIQVLYISELAADSGQNYALISNESKEYGYLETLTKETLTKYKEYGLAATLETNGFTKFQMILIYNDLEKLYSSIYSINTLKKISLRKTDSYENIINKTSVYTNSSTEKLNTKLKNEAVEIFEKFMVFKLALDNGFSGYGNASEYVESRVVLNGDINLDGEADIVIIYSIEGDGGGGNGWYRNIFLLTTFNNELTSDYKECFVYGKHGNRESHFLEIKNGFAIFNISGYDKTHRLGIGIREGQLVKEKILSN